MSRSNTAQVRLNDREKEYVSELANRFRVSQSEAIRIVLFDSRFLYSEDVSFGDVNMPADKVLSEEDVVSTDHEPIGRVTGN